MRRNFDSIFGRRRGSPWYVPKELVAEGVREGISGDCGDNMGTIRVALKAVNEELPKRGYTARLTKAASGYFYFECGEAADWLDKTANVPTVNSLTLPE